MMQPSVLTHVPTCHGGDGGHGQAVHGQHRLEGQAHVTVALLLRHVQGRVLTARQAGKQAYGGKTGRRTRSAAKPAT